MGVLKIEPSIVSVLISVLGPIQLSLPMFTLLEIVAFTPIKEEHPILQCPEITHCEEMKQLFSIVE